MQDVIQKVNDMKNVSATLNKHKEGADAFQKFSEVGVGVGVWEAGC